MRGERSRATERPVRAVDPCGIASSTRPFSKTDCVSVRTARSRAPSRESARRSVRQRRENRWDDRSSSISARTSVGGSCANPLPCFCAGFAFGLEIEVVRRRSATLTADRQTNYDSAMVDQNTIRAARLILAIVGLSMLALRASLPESTRFVSSTDHLCEAVEGSEAPDAFGTPPTLVDAPLDERQDRGELIPVADRIASTSGELRSTSVRGPPQPSA